MVSRASVRRENNFFINDCNEKELIKYVNKQKCSF
jgi:hypothetical protein